MAPGLRTTLATIGAPIKQVGDALGRSAKPLLAVGVGVNLANQLAMAASPDYRAWRSGNVGKQVSDAVVNAVIDDKLKSTINDTVKSGIDSTFAGVKTGIADGVTSASDTFRKSVTENPGTWATAAAVTATPMVALLSYLLWDKYKKKRAFSMPRRIFGMEFGSGVEHLKMPPMATPPAGKPLLTLNGALLGATGLTAGLVAHNTLNNTNQRVDAVAGDIRNLTSAVADPTPTGDIARDKLVTSLANKFAGPEAIGTYLSKAVTDLLHKPSTYIGGTALALAPLIARRLFTSFFPDEPAPKKKKRKSFYKQAGVWSSVTESLARAARGVGGAVDSGKSMAPAVSWFGLEHAPLIGTGTAGLLALSPGGAPGLVGPGIIKRMGTLVDRGEEWANAPIDQVAPDSKTSDKGATRMIAEGPINEVREMIGDKVIEKGVSNKIKGLVELPGKFWIDQVEKHPIAYGAGASAVGILAYFLAKRTPELVDNSYDIGDEQLNRAIKQLPEQVQFGEKPVDLKWS